MLEAQDTQVPLPRRDLRGNRSPPSVHGPYPGGQHFKQVAVRIAKVDARATARPGKAALDGDTMLGEVCLPRRQTRSRNTETDMRPSGGVVRGNHAERQRRAIWVAATNEEDKNLPLSGIESAETVVGRNNRVAENACIEVTCLWQVGHGEAGFQNRTCRRSGVVHVWGSGVEISPPAA